MSTVLTPQNSGVDATKKALTIDEQRAELAASKRNFESVKKRTFTPADQKVIDRHHATMKQADALKINSNIELFNKVYRPILDKFNAIPKKYREQFSLPTTVKAYFERSFLNDANGVALYDYSTVCKMQKMADAVQAEPDLIEKFESAVKETPHAMKGVAGFQKYSHPANETREIPLTRAAKKREEVKEVAKIEKKLVSVKVDGCEIRFTFETKDVDAIHASFALAIAKVKTQFGVDLAKPPAVKVAVA